MGYQLSAEEKKDVRPEIIDHLGEEDKVSFAYLHGSFLKGEFNDLDLAIYIVESEDKKRCLILS